MIGDKGLGKGSFASKVDPATKVTDIFCALVILLDRSPIKLCNNFLYILQIESSACN